MQPETAELGIPIREDDVTPAWLAQALQRDFPGVKVAAMRAEGLHDGTALTSRLHMEYASVSSAGPSTVCLKAGLDGPPHREFIFKAGLFSKEAMVYQDLLPNSSARVPRCFAAAFDTTKGSFVLFDDLHARDVFFCGSDEPLTVNETASGLEQLAGLHWILWNDPALESPRWRHRGRSLAEDDPLEAHMRSMLPAVVTRMLE